jgi:hypothetical protein
MNPSDTIPRSSRWAAAIALLLIFNSAYAQLDSYGYQRKIKLTGKEDWYSIPLNSSIQSRSECLLSDFRIYRISDKDTTEIPYLSEKLGDKTSVKEIPFELVNNTSNEKCCSYVTLKFDGKKVINEIDLNVQESNFDKWVKVQGSMDNKEWFTIRERVRIVGFSNGDESYRYTALRFSSSEYSYFRLVLDDDGSDRITITGASASEVRTDVGSYEELKVKDKNTKQNKENKTTEIILDLSYSCFIDHVVIKPSTQEEFYRNVNLYYLAGVTKTEKGDIEHWTLVNTGIFTSLDDHGETAAFPYTVLSCEDQKTSRLKLEIVNRDNQPVEVKDIQVFAESVRLVSKLPAQGDVVLAYGRPSCPSPEYDIVHFTKKIPEYLVNVELGDEKITDKNTVTKEPLIKDQLWLWVAMGAILLIIALFSVRMLKKA